jgi:formate hydrogenlyase transcriptional activator
MGAGESPNRTPLELRAFIDGVPALAWSALPDGSPEFFNQRFLDYSGLSPDQFYAEWKSTLHRDDMEEFERWWGRLQKSQKPGQMEVRFRRAEGEYRWFQISAAPIHDEQGRLIRWYGINIDIDDRKRAEEASRSSEQSLRLMLDSIPGHVATLTAEGELEVANRQSSEYFGKTTDELKNWATNDTIHPDDLQATIKAVAQGIAGGQPFEWESRARRVDGVYLWYHVRCHPQRDRAGRIVRWCILGTDIDDRRRAEQEVRQKELDLRTITDAIRQFIVVLAPDGTTLYANKVALENTGFTISDLTDEGLLTRAGLARPAYAAGELAWNQVWRMAAHPDDRDRIQAERQKGLLQGTPFELEARCLFKTGQYRWQLFQYNPLKDESGQIIRWYVTATDIDDRKRMEEQLRNENLVLREEIDRSSMFEEIVGSSKPMRQLVKHVEKVAPADSTVLILGETGTGKELVARALHRRSKRANRAFVRVNCAAIPQSLIASELFGHEKGAFTGALQRRVGRFEAADGGTLFLDEIGELPMETQISLLRVLQEREFERVGSNHPISVDVRLIAATNRDPRASVAAGTFRQDLFYRLNVFPIAVPPLRERAEDIPLLVEYFVGRFAKSSGKTIRHIGKDAMEKLKAYDWPGNIRELQNVVERAVILMKRTRS